MTSTGSVTDSSAVAKPVMMLVAGPVSDDLTISLTGRWPFAV